MPYRARSSRAPSSARSSRAPSSARSSISRVSFVFAGLVQPSIISRVSFVSAGPTQLRSSKMPYRARSSRVPSSACSSISRFSWSAMAPGSAWSALEASSVSLSCTSLQGAHWYCYGVTHAPSGRGAICHMSEYLFVLIWTYLVPVLIISFHGFWLITPPVSVHTQSIILK